MKTGLKTIFSAIVLFLMLYSCDKDELMTGLEGKVYRGPINPVATIGVDNDEPFSAEFHVYDHSNKLLISFTSDDNGNYQVKMPPGVYLIVPDETAIIMHPEQQFKEVTVLSEEITEADLYFDTGIR